MSDSRYCQVEDLFQRVADLPRDRQAAYLDEHGGDDPAVRAQVERLLTHLDGEMIGSLADVERLDELDMDLSGGQVGAYKLVRLIGEGGFGAVFLAQQETPVRRTVALKIIKLGMDTKHVIARFEAERQALAMMEHPNIAKVFDAGATDSGRPYFAMEFVDGVPITRYCDEHRLTTGRRLDLFVHVCSAVQHAHQKGIIHRDLKPSNVLVALRDGEPVPTVIDFGIAKATSGRLTEKPLLTDCLRFIGTPQYMSPEQAEMSELDVDARSDIYSLGVLLYELLTGTTPFDSKTLHNATYAEIQRIVCNQEPPTPSQRTGTLDDELASIAKSRRVDPRSLRRLLRGDLDWIVMKALEKDRARRYETAASLATDVRCHLAGEPVLAGPPGRMYKLGKFIRRNKFHVAMGSMAAAALLVGFIVAMTGYVRARTEAVSARTINTFFNNMLVSVDPMQLRLLSALAPSDQTAPVAPGGFARDVSVAQMMRLASTEIGEAFTGKPELEAVARETTGMTLRGLGCYAEAEPQLQAALDIRSRVLGDDHPDTLRSKLLLGDLILDKGRATEAEPLVRSALAGMERIYGTEHPKTLSCASILAVTLGDQCQHDAAGRIFQSTLDAQRRILGSQHRDTLTTIWKWSVAYLARRVLPDGQALADELYETSRRRFGPDDSLNVLATPLVGWWNVVQRQYDQAEPLLRFGLEQCRSILGEEHPFTYMTMHGLAQSICREENSEEAESLYRAALAGLRATRSGQHWQSLYVTKDFAAWLASRGRFEEAGQRYRELATDCMLAFGEKDTFALSTLTWLADFLEHAGELDDAIAVRRERLEIIQRHRGSESPFGRAELVSFAKALVRMGRMDAGRQVTRELLEHLRVSATNEDDPAAINRYAWNLLTCTPPDLRDVDAALSLAERAVQLSEGKSAGILDTLARAYHEMGEDDMAAQTQAKAMALLPPGSRSRFQFAVNRLRFSAKQGALSDSEDTILEVVEEYKAISADDSPRLTMQLIAIVERVADAGAFALAETLLEEVLELNLESLGEEHLEVARILTKLADTYALQADQQEATATFARALAVRLGLLGDDHLQVAETRHSLGLALYAEGDTAGALVALGDALDTYRQLAIEYSPDGLSVIRDVAAVLIALGSLGEAEPLVEEALAKTQALYGAEHPGTVGAMKAAGMILIEQGDLEEAEVSLRRCMDICSRLDLSGPSIRLPAEIDGALGLCLTRMRRFEEAESLLLDSYSSIHTAVGEAHIDTKVAVERLVALYSAWDRPDREAQWSANPALSVRFQR